MVSLVEQIQRDAINADVRVTQVLMRMKLAAAKLQLNTAESWVEKELNGYTGDLPDYRLLSGKPMAFNRYNGWVPIIGLNSKYLREFPVVQPIASLEELINNPELGAIKFDLPPAWCADLDQIVDVPMHRYAIHFSKVQVLHIVNAVRNAALQWAIDLEKNGITGLEFAFTHEEVAKARDAHMNISIGPGGVFNGVVGNHNTTGSQIIGPIDIGKAVSVAGELEKHLKSLAGEGVDRREVASKLKTIQAEAKKASPDKGIIHGAFVDLRNLISGAGGSLVATGALELIKSVLG